MKKNHPAVIIAHRSAAKDVRKAALSIGLAVREEVDHPSELDAVLLHFGDLTDNETIALANAVPREAYYFEAEFVRRRERQ